MQFLKTHLFDVALKNGSVQAPLNDPPNRIGVIDQTWYTTGGVTKHRVAKLSIVTEEAPPVDEDPLNNGGQDEDVFLGVENKGAKPKRPTRSRKSTLGSVNSQTSALSASANPEDASNKGVATNKLIFLACFL